MTLHLPDPAELAAARADPRRRFGHYLLLRELGRGGMGVVYAAWDELPRRLVALKVLPDAATPEAMKRFEREAEALARIGHPGIVPVHAAGVLGGKQFIAMALLPGGTLKTRLAARGLAPLSLVRRVEIVAEVARAVHAAHAQGIVHRDLKPDNVLLDGDGRPYVADFGLARFVDGKSRLTQSNATLGTASFMAPEQLEGGAVDARADVYSLGATLYFVLTGRAPFEGTSALNVFVAALKQRAKPPSSWSGDVTPAVEAVCLQCLEKRPSLRPQTAEALAVALERALEEPERGAPRGRAPWVVALIIVGVLTALVVAVVIVKQGETAPVVPVVPVAKARRPAGIASVASRATPRPPRVTELTLRWSVDVGIGMNSVSFRPPAWSEVATVDAPLGGPGSVKRWSAATGKPLGTLGDVGDGAIVAWAPDGKRLLASGRQRTVLWDVDTGAVIKEYENDRIMERPAERTPARLEGLEGYQLRSVRFLDDGRLLCADLQRRAVFLDATTLAPTRFHAFAGFEVESVDMSARGDALGAVVYRELRPGADSCLVKAREQDLSGVPQAASHEGQPLIVSDGQFCGNNHAVSGLWNADGIFVWDLDGAATVIPAIDPSPQDGGVPRIAVAGQTVVGVSRDGSLLVWDLRGDVSCVLRHRGAHTASAAIAVTPDGTRLATAGADGTLRMWDLPAW